MDIHRKEGPRNLHLFIARRLSILLLTIVMVAGASALPKLKKDGWDIRVRGLECEHQDHPLGIDAAHPRLSWIILARPGLRGQFQKACRIQVASSMDALVSGKPDLWDSGAMDTSRSNNVAYGGAPLQSSTRCYWRVKVWTMDGKRSEWSAPAYWETGLLHDTDWKGKWIGEPNPRGDSDPYSVHPAPLFRREFRVPKKIRKAVLYITGLGYYECYLNGKKTSNTLLDPGWTDYSKTIPYRSCDVTALLKKGVNCAGVMLGNGWYNPLPLRMWGRINLRESLTVGLPKFILQLHIEYTDGTSGDVVSDSLWKEAPGPVLKNNVYLGEVDDGRADIAGWNKAGVPAKGWQPATITARPPGVLRAEEAPPVVAGDTLAPVGIARKKDRYIVDFGRNFGGIIRLAADGPRGTVITVRYGELLNSDGSVNVMTSTAGQIKRKGTGGPGAPDTAYAKDVFILKGNGKETFQPHFTFHGFRYIEVSGYPGTLERSDVRGLALHADVSSAGTFSCSDTLLNDVQKVCRNTFLSNLFSVQSDCPHRERFGYGGDIVATCRAYMANFDMARFYTKTVSDFADEAQPDGGLTETAPFVGIASDGLGGKSGPVEWASVMPVLLQRLYQYYGDIRLIQQEYNTIRNWVDFMSRHANHYLIDATIGDHESLDPKLVALSATAFYYYDTHLLTGFARLLDKTSDVTRYAALEDSIKNAFIRHFFDPATGQIGIHTAAAQAYGLYFHLVPENSRSEALAVLLKDIETNREHITSGIFGTAFLMDVLSQTGHEPVAFRMATQKTFPGWGYMLASGATTLWEHWAPSSNTYSHNHPMFGSISDWFFRYLAGIRPEENAAGFDRIAIEPPAAGLQWARATYHSVLGLVASSWKIQGNSFTLELTIPVNATATVHIPASLESIRENGKKIGANRLFHLVSSEPRESIFRLGSGTYHFSAVLPGS